MAFVSDVIMASRPPDRLCSLFVVQEKDDIVTVRGRTRGTGQPVCHLVPVYDRALWSTAREDPVVVVVDVTVAQVPAVYYAIRGQIRLPLSLR